MFLNGTSHHHATEEVALAHGQKMKQMFLIRPSSNNSFDLFYLSEVALQPNQPIFIIRAHDVVHDYRE